MMVLLPNHVSAFTTSDGMVLQERWVQQMVTAMAAYSLNSSGALSITLEQHQQLAPILAAAWQ